MFKKKKKQETPVVEQKPLTFEFKCPHTWQDFDWYIKSQYSNNTVTIQLYEPYVCISCKERMDKLLEQRTFPNVKSCVEAERIIKSYTEQYSGRIKPKPIVEDQVNDFQLIDRRFLEVAKRIYHLPEVETSTIDFKEATFYSEKQFTEPKDEIKYTSTDKMLGFDSEGCGPTSCTNLLLGALAKKSNCDIVETNNGKFIVYDTESKQAKILGCFDSKLAAEKFLIDRIGLKQSGLTTMRM